MFDFLFNVFYKLCARILIYVILISFSLFTLMCRSFPCPTPNQLIRFYFNIELLCFAFALTIMIIIFSWLDIYFNSRLLVLYETMVVLIAWLLQLEIVLLLLVLSWLCFIWLVICGQIGSSFIDPNWHCSYISELADF